MGFLGGSGGKNQHPKQESQMHSLGQEDRLEEELATHSRTLAWRTPWTEEPGWLHTVHGVAKSQM